jgi:hypothetical protein
MGHGGAAESMHWKEANSITIKHRAEHAAHGALLGPDLNPVGLLIPEVPAIGLGYAARVLSGVGPRRHTLDGAGLVDDPLPRNYAPLTRLLQQAVDALHLRSRHRCNEAAREQLVTDPPTGDRLCSFDYHAHRLDQVERALRHATTYSGTGSKIVGIVDHAAPPSASWMGSASDTVSCTGRSSKRMEVAVSPVLTGVKRLPAEGEGLDCLSPRVGIFVCRRRPRRLYNACDAVIVKLSYLPHCQNRKHRGPGRHRGLLFCFMSLLCDRRPICSASACARPAAFQATARSRRVSTL